MENKKSPTKKRQQKEKQQTPNASPVCYANDPEIRKEYRDQPSKK